MSFNYTSLCDTAIDNNWTNFDFINYLSQNVFSWASLIILIIIWVGFIIVGISKDSWKYPQFWAFLLIIMLATIMWVILFLTGLFAVFI